MLVLKDHDEPSCDPCVQQSDLNLFYFNTICSVRHDLDCYILIADIQIYHTKSISQTIDTCVQNQCIIK